MIDFNKKKVVPIHLPPQDLDTEETLLASILVDGSTLEKIEDILRPEDFYNTTHGLIYSAFLSLKLKGHKPDLVTTADELEKQGNLKRIGGVSMLTKLSDEAPASLNPEGHARIVKEYSIKRQIAAIGHKLVDYGLSNKSVEDLLSFGRAELEKIQPPISKNGSRFQLKRLSEIEFRAPDWLIESFIEKDTLATFFGDPASTKTFGAIDIACSLATGKDFHGMKVKQGPVVYIAGEGQNGIKRRFMAWGIRHGYNLDDAPIFLSLMPAALCDQEQTGWVINAIKQISKDCGEPGLIVFDTVARNFGPGDENSTKDMSGFINSADLIREQCKACILLIHHTGHQNKERGRGNMALKGALDSEYRFEKDEQGVVRVTNTKMKDFVSPEPMAFRLATVELPFKDEDGNHITSAILDTTDYTPSKKENAQVKGKTQMKVYSIIKEMLQSERDRVAEGGGSIEDAKILIEDVHRVCIEDEMHRNTWYKMKKWIEGHMLIKSDSAHIYDCG
jgi:AAA domain/DnaB-like helicase N terminal domain